MCKPFLLADVEAHHREIVVWLGTIAEGFNSLLKRLYDLHSVFEVCFPKSSKEALPIGALGFISRNSP